MQQILFIALGGASGAVMRFLVSQLINNSTRIIFPWATMTVNMIGSFLIGFLIELFSRSIVPSGLRAFVIIGFLGAFTTFSTYALESVNLLKGNEIKLFLQNILLHNILGLLMVILGIYFSRTIIKYLI